MERKRPYKPNPKLQGRIPWNKGKTPIGTCIICGKSDQSMCKGGTKKPYCKSCRNKEERSKYDPIKDRNRHLKYWYGITIEEYNYILVKQKYLCAICSIDLKIQKKINLDHNHKTGAVRSILCVRCNLSLGLIEDEDWIKKARKYLKLHKK